MCDLDMCGLYLCHIDFLFYVNISSFSLKGEEMEGEKGWKEGRKKGGTEG